jgi:steroid delta-isomerase-like uncharacterized protein
MSGEQNRAVVRRFFAAIDGRDPAGVEAALAPSYACHFVGAPGPMDGATFAGFVSGFQAAFPDLTHTVEELLVEGDTGAARLTIRGTQRGDFQGIPASGRTVEFKAMNHYRFEGGRIVEQWAVADMLGMLQQLGAIPAAA